MNIPKKKMISFGIITVLSIMVMLTIFEQNTVEIEINQNLHITVARVSRIVDNRSLTRVYYNYYYKGVSFESSEMTNLNIDEEILKKFYEVKISSTDPSKSRIQLLDEVTDFTRIQSAGFLTDLIDLNQK